MLPWVGRTKVKILELVGCYLEAALLLLQTQLVVEHSPGFTEWHNRLPGNCHVTCESRIKVLAESSRIICSMFEMVHHPSFAELRKTCTPSLKYLSIEVEDVLFIAASICRSPHR